MICFQNVFLVLCSTTSGFGLQRQLTDARISCVVVNAADVPQTDKGRKTKTDRSDSKRIAAYFILKDHQPCQEFDYHKAMEYKKQKQIQRYKSKLMELGVTV